jgi:probable rRNA maturation factor
MSISFHVIHPTKVAIKRADIKNWIKGIVANHNKKPGNINIIFVSDEYLLEINRNYLKHDYLTDIITFNYNTESIISGDIYISIPRIKENSDLYNCTVHSEILRVIIHGIYHLIGFDDKTMTQKQEMSQLEDIALRSFPGSISI